MSSPHGLHGSPCNHCVSDCLWKQHQLRQLVAPPQKRPLLPLCLSLYFFLISATGRSISHLLSRAETWLLTGWSCTAEEALWAQNVSNISNLKDGWVITVNRKYANTLLNAKLTLTVFSLYEMNSGLLASTWLQTTRQTKTWLWSWVNLSPSKQDRWAADDIYMNGVVAVSVS